MEKNVWMALCRRRVKFHKVPNENFEESLPKFFADIPVGFNRVPEKARKNVPVKAQKGSGKGLEGFGADAWSRSMGF